jgi:hypothetical protein
LSDWSESGVEDEDAAHRVAAQIADELAPMVSLARRTRLDFLAYLLGLALTHAGFRRRNRVPSAKCLSFGL